MPLDLKALAKEVSQLSPDERATLAAVLTGGEAKPQPERKALPPEEAKAKPVFFFRSPKTGRIFPTNIREASRLFWAFRAYEYLGVSSGETWKAERRAGKSVAEAQEAEYQHMLKEGSREPPPDPRATNLGKGNAFNLERAMSATLNAHKDLDFKRHAVVAKEETKDE